MGSMWNELFSSHGKDRIDNCTEDVLNTKESCRWGRHSAGLLLVLIIDLAALMVLKHQKAVNQWSCIKDRCQVLIFCNTNAER